MWFFACLSLAAAEPARAEPAPTDPAPADPAALPEKRFSWVAIPNFGYDVDDGFGAGARAELDWYAPGYDPYQLAFVTQAYLTTNGYHHHRVRFDAPGLGPDHRLRLSGHFAYRQWLNDGYWGMGNDTTLTQASVEDPDQAQYYRYTLVQPFGRLTLRGELGGPWAWFAFLAGRWSQITTYEGSLLEAEAPLGMAGGWGIQPGVGMLYDTREPELTPDGGVLAELAVRGMPKLPGADGEWISVFASLRGFVTLGPRVVIASRLMGEASFGDVPFYDLNTWGGLVPTMGFGGADSIRGVNFGRWRDRNKLATNHELRIDVYTHSVLQREIRWQVVPFFDAGMVWGEEPLGDFPVHPGLGLGIHPIVADTFVGRFDAAVGLDQVESANGTRETIPNLGIYVVFEHML